jgi:hypothetical protein
MLPPVASGAAAAVTSFALPTLPPIPSPLPETEAVAEAQPIVNAMEPETTELSVDAPVTHSTLDSLAAPAEESDSVVIKVQAAEQAQESVADSLPKTTTPQVVEPAQGDLLTNAPAADATPSPAPEAEAEANVEEAEAPKSKPGDTPAAG